MPCPLRSLPHVLSHRSRDALSLCYIPCAGQPHSVLVRAIACSTWPPPRQRHGHLRCHGGLQPRLRGVSLLLFHPWVAWSIVLVGANCSYATRCHTLCALCRSPGRALSKAMCGHGPSESLVKSYRECQHRPVPGGCVWVVCLFPCSPAGRPPSQPPRMSVCSLACVMVFVAARVAKQ